jgi:hypothetical protein
VYGREKTQQILRRVALVDLKNFHGLYVHFGRIEVSEWTESAAYQPQFRELGAVGAA